MNTPPEQFIADAFHVLYYTSPHTWNGGVTTYKGVPILKNPCDLWVLQETIHATRPDLIIETGTCSGGSALYYSELFPELRVITIDTQEEFVPQVRPPRVTFLKGSSTAPAIIAKVKAAAKRAKRIMVILDSDHTTPHVLAELKTYAPLVTPGCYCVVEDTNLDSAPLHHPAYVDNGPLKAVHVFLQKNKDFVIDRDKEKLFLTFYPCGWLLRK